MGKKIIEVWTTDWKKTNLKSDNLKALEEMAIFFSKMLKDFTSTFHTIETEQKENMYFGMPVKILHYEKEKLTGKYEVEEIREEIIKSSFLEPPVGYKKEKFDEKEAK